MAGVFVIITPPEWLGWEVKLAATEAIVNSAGKAAWNDAMESFFDATQRVVHVRTGKLQRSGSYRTSGQGATLEGEVSYSALHALTEISRGGPHDFMAQGWNVSEATVAGGMDLVFGAVVASWS